MDVGTLDKFIIPVIYFLQMSFIGTALLFSLTEKKVSWHYCRRLLIPLLLFVAIYLCCWGLTVRESPFTLAGYRAFIATTTAHMLSWIFYAVVIALFVCVTFHLFRELDGFHRRLCESFDYAQYNRWRRFRFLIYSFTVYFTFSALDFICSHRLLDMVMVWVGTAYFLLIVLLYYYMEYHFENRRPADPLAERFYPGRSALTMDGLKGPEQEEQAIRTSGVQVGSLVEPQADSQVDNRMPESSFGPQPGVVNVANIEEALRTWTTREDKPFMNEGVTLVNTAESMQVHPRLLSGYLNSVYRVNFNTWINQLRVEELKRLLVEQPDRTLNDLSHDAGFTDSSAMSKVFKRITGELPSHYRNRLINRE